MKKALVIGGGVSGCTIAHQLKQANFEVTILEKNTNVGGLSRTYYYHGHPYEFGPHVWFWPGDRENKLVYDLADGLMWSVDRKLISVTEEGSYRYPIHYDDILEMADKDQVLAEFATFRDKNNVLAYNQLPKIGNCKFAEYFRAAIGPTLYNRFMKEYTHKMWGISGDQLETTMVWADRMKDGADVKYDPIKFKDHSLGQGLDNWYPQSSRGWNIVWEKMADGCRLINNIQHLCLKSDGHLYITIDGVITTIDTRTYDTVVCTIHPDTLVGEFALPATGRLIVPLLMPKTAGSIYDGIESVHYADSSPATRTTDMDIITRYRDDRHSLLLVEIPIDGTNQQPMFPSNVIRPEHYCQRCYARQTPEALSLYENYVTRIQSINKNIVFAGRHGKFKYWGMPETVKNGIDTAERITQ